MPAVLKTKLLNKLVGITVLLLLILTVSVWIIYYAVKSSESTGSYGPLPERVRVFIDTQSQDQNSKWRYQADDETANSVTELATDLKTDCFSLSSPFPVRRIKIENSAESCILRANMFNPFASIVISMKPMVGSLEDLPDVTMRKKMAEIYQQLPPTTRTESQLIFKSKDELTYFLVIDDNLITISFSQLQQIELLDLDQTHQLILSLKVL